MEILALLLCILLGDDTFTRVVLSLLVVYHTWRLVSLIARYVREERQRRD